MDEYYIKEICKFKAILTQLKDEAIFENKAFHEYDYFLEKINRVLAGIPIGIHPNLKKIVYEDLKRFSPSISVISHLDDGKVNWDDDEILILSDSAKFDAHENIVNEKHWEEQNEIRNKTT